MGDHTEAISIDYDPEKISYSDLLNYFWRGHRCESNNSSIQYQNAIFYRDKEQQELAEASLKAWAERGQLTVAEVATEIRPIKEFTYAEKYHQKYAISGEIRDSIDDLFPDAKSLADSTVATRINAYLGYGMGKSPEVFLAELSEYGLTDELESKIRKRLEMNR